MRILLRNEARFKVRYEGGCERSRERGEKEGGERIHQVPFEDLLRKESEARRGLPLLERRL